MPIFSMPCLELIENMHTSEFKKYINTFCEQVSKLIKKSIN